MLKALGRIHDADEARRAIDAALASLRQRQPRPHVRRCRARALDDGARRHRRGARVPARRTSRPTSSRSSRTRCSAASRRSCRSTTRPPTCSSRSRRCLASAGYEHYETSAFAQPGQRCRHNLNYWEFGDYLGIGAGAHGKLSFPDRVTRHERAKQPREYLQARSARSENRAIAAGRAAVRVHAERAAPGRRLSGRAVQRAHRPAVARRRAAAANRRKRKACSSATGSASGRPSAGSASSTSCWRFSCRGETAGRGSGGRGAVRAPRTWSPVATAKPFAAGSSSGSCEKHLVHLLRVVRPVGRRVQVCRRARACAPRARRTRGCTRRRLWWRFFGQGSGKKRWIAASAAVGDHVLQHLDRVVADDAQVVQAAPRRSGSAGCRRPGRAPRPR